MKASFHILLYALILTVACSELFYSSSKKIGIQVFGAFNKSELELLQASLSDQFNRDVVFMEAKEMPQRAFVNIKTPRYRADTIIKILKESKHDSLGYVLGLTALDISCTKKDALGRVKKPESKYKDWGIFGLGYRPGPSCIVSNYRLKHKNYSVYKDRLIKVCTHEIGHNMGLPHCETEGCVMQDAAETIKTIDRVNSEFCALCRNKIQD